MAKSNMEDDGLETHLWVGNHSREIRIAGEPIILYRCPICSRDFARLPGRSNWKAIPVSTFSIMFLADAITQEWLKEPCPRSTPPSAEKFENARENRNLTEATGPSRLLLNHRFEYEIPCEWLKCIAALSVAKLSRRTTITLRWAWTGRLRQSPAFTLTYACQRIW